jgi:putative transposase
MDPALIAGVRVGTHIGKHNLRALMGDEHWHGQSEALLQSHRKRPVVSAAAIIAVAASTDGKREIVGLHIGPSEAETLWTGFLKSLHRRGLKGVRLVISGAHEGLKAAIRRILNASWQHCCQSARERGFSRTFRAGRACT